MCFWSGSLKIGWIVGTVDIVTRLLRRSVDVEAEEGLYAYSSPSLRKVVHGDIADEERMRNK